MMMMIILITLAVVSALYKFIKLSQKSHEAGAHIKSVTHGHTFGKVRL